MKNLLARTLTTVVTVPLVLYAVFLGREALLAVVLAIIILALQEFFHLGQSRGLKPLVIEGTAAVVALLFLAFSLSSFPSLLFWRNVFAWPITLLAVVWLFSELAYNRIFLVDSSLTYTIKGVLYFGWFPSYFILLRNLPRGQWAFFFLLLAVWVFDSAAYFIGVAFGRHKIWPAISPKKSWEGLIGGLVFCCLTTWLVGLPLGLPWEHCLVLGLLLGVLAQAGDLVESHWKRWAGVKDSGNVLPGHGGLLDRLDSFIITAPFFYYYLEIFGLFK